MTESLPIDESAAQTAQVDQLDQRLLWTGAAANGALILALIGFAGNAGDQAAALRLVTIPALLSVAGFSFGGAAITNAAARLAHRPLEAIAHRQMALAHQQAAAFHDVFAAPSIDPTVARLIWGDQADDEARKLLLGRLANAQDAADKCDATFAEGMEAWEMHAKAGVGLLERAQRWLVASFVAAALSVVVLLGQAWFAKTAPATPPPPSGPAATLPAEAISPAVIPRDDLPPCRNGATDCNPWERAWQEPPRVGTVVPAPSEQPRR